MNKFLLLVMLLCLGICGCGTWSSMPDVPGQTLRNVDTLELQPAATQPVAVGTTAPSRVAATEPAPPGYPLSIAEARATALSNNLDLRVELLNPTIARAQLSAEEARFEALFTTDVNFAVNDSPTANRT